MPNGFSDESNRSMSDEQFMELCDRVDGEFNDKDPQMEMTCREVGNGDDFDFFGKDTLYFTFSRSARGIKPSLFAESYMNASEEEKRLDVGECTMSDGAKVCKVAEEGIMGSRSLPDSVKSELEEKNDTVYYVDGETITYHRPPTPSGGEFTYDDFDYQDLP